MLARSIWQRHTSAPAVATFYSTAFPLTENPISEGGIYTQGLSTGLDWQDCRTTPGKCFATGDSGASGFNDPIMVMANRWTNNKHYSQATIFKQAGYAPSAAHEIELHVGTTITAHSVKTYEVNWALGTPVTVIRWDGAVGVFDFAMASPTSGTAFTCTHGDVIKAVYNATSGNVVIDCYLNGVLGCTFTDSTAGKILTGSPGWGFFARPAGDIVLSNYCFSAGSLGNA